MNKSPHRLSLPSDRLPSDSAKRHAILGEYFGDLLASAEATEAGWIVDLTWPDFQEFFVDPLLQRSLEWWRKGLRLTDIRKSVVWTKSGQLSLDDAWTLFAWSRWLKERNDRGRLPNQVIIIHVDDHRDLMTPRIAWDGTRWNDLLTGHQFTIFDPDSVRSAIMSGAIGVGSFIAPFLHELPSVLIRHLCQSAALAEDRREWWLVRETAEDTIISPGHFRPRVRTELIAAEGSLQPPADIVGRYRFTQSYEYCFSDLPVAPVLLHIDMDYFNNRFDRDSDWQERAGRIDPDETALVSHIDKFFTALGESNVESRIENVTVALSPGFFPSEYWETAIERVEKHLLALGLSLGRDKNGQVIYG